MGIPERRAQRNEPTMHSREGRGNEASRGLCTRGEQAGGRARGASRQLRRLNDEKTAAPTMADSGDAAQATETERYNARPVRADLLMAEALRLAKRPRAIDDWTGDHDYDGLFFT